MDPHDMTLGIMDLDNFTQCSEQNHEWTGIPTTEEVWCKKCGEEDHVIMKRSEQNNSGPKAPKNMEDVRDYGFR